MLEGLNLVSWSKFKRSKLSDNIAFATNNGPFPKKPPPKQTKMTGAGLEWEISPVQKPSCSTGTSHQATQQNLHRPSFT